MAWSWGLRADSWGLRAGGDFISVRAGAFLLSCQFWSSSIEPFTDFVGVVSIEVLGPLLSVGTAWSTEDVAVVTPRPTAAEWWHVKSSWLWTRVNCRALAACAVILVSGSYLYKLKRRKL